MSTTKSIVTVVLATTGAFFTGLAVGLLVAPRSGKENRRWLKQQAGDITDWVDYQSKEALNRTENKFNHLKADVKTRIKNSIPDLYEATADFQLDESELIERENE